MGQLRDGDGGVISYICTAELPQESHLGGGGGGVISYICTAELPQDSQLVDVGGAVIPCMYIITPP